MYVDIGASSREEAEKVVHLGDSVCFDSLFDTQNSMIRGRALDDRAGCAILIDMIQSELPYDMTFVFCVQEEVGTRDLALRLIRYSHRLQLLWKQLRQRMLQVFLMKSMCAAWAKVRLFPLWIKEPFMTVLITIWR